MTHNAHYTWGDGQEICNRCGGTGEVTVSNEDGSSSVVDCWHGSPPSFGKAKTFEERIEYALKQIKKLEGSEKWDWLERPRGKNEQ